MIVKNESHIIRYTLNSLISKIPEIDYYVICDTGSIDNTPQIITEFFQEKKIRGELHHDEWKDFGYNRSKALEYAFNKSKYLIIFDANNEIIGDFKLPANLDKYDALNLQFGPQLYEKTLIIKNDKKWRFKGVLHEYIDAISFTPKTITIKGNYHIISCRTGNRNKDLLKYKKEAIILEKAFKDAQEQNDDIFNRYAFYCAQSYNDAGENENAIIWYNKRLDLNGCIQEKYWSCFQLYKKLKDQGKENEGIYFLVKSFEYDIERYECMYELIQYYCSKGLDKIAWNYYQMIQSDYEENFLQRELINKLFYWEWYGAFGLPYYMIIVSINTGNFESTIKMYDIIFEKKFPELSEFYIGCLFSNYNFINNKLGDKTEEFKLKFKNYLKFLESINYPIYKHNENLIKYGVFDRIEIKNKSMIHSKNILIYIGYAPNNFNYSCYKNGALGGSETAAIELALNLPRDYNIYIIGSGVINENYKNISFVCDNEAKELIGQTEFYVIIVSRYLDFFTKYSNYKSYQLHVWAHDVMFHCDNLLNEYDYLVDKYICLTEWHKNSYIQKYPIIKEKIIIINNGININIKNNYEKVPNRFIYSSCIERGLKKLLELWQDIMQYFQDAELYICCYNALSDNSILEMIKKYDSIKYLGCLNKNTLYRLMETCEYWLYPTDWPETSCITAMEMMAHRVLCLYYPIAGLPDTIGENNGIQLKLGEEIKTLKEIDNKDFILDNSQKQAEKYLWKNNINRWEKLLSLNIYLIILDKYFHLENLIDYFDSLSTKYTILFTKDFEESKKINPKKVFFINSIFDNDIYQYFKYKNIEINILNTEPLNIACRLSNLLFYREKINYYYDYSKSNIKILNDLGIINTIYFPYIIYEKESSFLRQLRDNTNIEFDFGIILKDREIERRNRIIKYIQDEGFKINIIENAWKDARDKELAKCKYILNIHGFYQETTKIFEHIRCDRLLSAGYNILSEECLHLDLDFQEKYRQNLSIINYEDFLNKTILEKVLKKKKKIIDCFIFYNEIDLLIYRINLLYKIVDYFIIVEANQTFIGLHKKSHYLENQEKFKKFSNKIVHIVVDLPNFEIHKNPWVNEKLQRNSIKRGIQMIEKKLTDDDLIIISDADEIPNPKILTDHYINDIYCLMQDFYYYNLHSKMNEKWFKSKILTFKKYKELNIEIEELRFYNCGIIKNGGWHLSYFGDAQFIKNKIENFSHQEYNSNHYKDNIEKNIKNCRDIFNRDCKMEYVEIEKNDNLPPLYHLYLKKYYNVFKSFLNFLNNNHYVSAWSGHFEFAIWLVNFIKPNLTVELGVDYGHSLFCFAFPNIGKVIGIDCFEGDIHTGYRNTEKIIMDTKNNLLNQSVLENDNITIIKGFFNDVAKTFHEKIDILHIDGLHTYDAVKNDFLTWLPKTNENTIILFHDVVSFPNDVGRFFREIQMPRFYFTHSAGLGVVCKNVYKLQQIIHYLRLSELNCNNYLVYSEDDPNCFVYNDFNQPIIKIKIFIIHYEKLTERKKSILYQLNNLNFLNFEFITIDRDKLSEHDTSIFDETFEDSLKAISLSHYFAYNEIISKYDYALIFEDDVILNQDFTQQLNKYFLELPKDFDIVFLGDGCGLHVDKSEIINNKHVYKRNQTYTRCADSYIISKKCCIKIQNYIKNLDSKINKSIDCWLEEVFSKQKNYDIYWCEPTICTQGSQTGEFDRSWFNNPNLSNFLEKTNKIQIDEFNNLFKKNSFQDLRFYFGTERKQIDITDIVFKFLNNHEIIIPGCPDTRVKYFSDPLFGVFKNIFITLNNKYYILKKDTNTYIDTYFKYVIDSDSIDINDLICYKSPFDKLRLGKDNDGGYIICNIPNINYDLFISCGIADDISFEENFCNFYQNIKCLAFDGTINHFNHPNIIFNKKNISYFNDQNNTNLIDEIQDYENIFLKMDIEGSEISWINSLSNIILNKFSQIVIEFHFPFSYREVLSFQKLAKNHVLVHFHPNNCCGTRKHKEIDIPNVFECTYIHKKFYKKPFIYNTENIPGILDMKNVLQNADICINYKPFVYSKPRLVCFIHSCKLNNTKQTENIVDYMIKIINLSGLIKIFDFIYINNIGYLFTNNYQNDKIYINQYSSNPSLFELPTLNKIRDYASVNPDNYILYLHSKGASYEYGKMPNNERINNIKDWIDMMLFHLVENHEKCILKLNESYDVLGCNYYPNDSKIPNHFSGNFWWANSNYIKSLPPLDEINVDKMQGEFWLFKNNPKFFEMYASKIDHYMQSFPLENYSKNSLLQSLRP